MSFLEIGYAEVAARMSLVGDAEPMYCVFGIAVSVPPFDQATANAVSTACANFFKPLLCTSFQYQGCTIRVGSDGGAIIWESVTLAGAGTQASSNAPQNTAQLLRKRTARAGRKGQGRMYVPGIAENKVSDAGAVEPTMITSINNEAAAFLTDLNAAGTPMVLLHTTAADGAPNLVTSFVADAKVATQRRRLR